jgi:hypothetical protein
MALVGERTMVDRREDLRKEAARLIEAAKTASTPETRAALIELANKFLQLADYEPSVDLDAVLDEFNARQMTRPKESKPVMQQQQQQQPKDQKPDKTDC